MKTSFSALFREAQKRPPGPNQYAELVESIYLAFAEDPARIRGIRELTPPSKIGWSVLIGVVVYSLPELELLDAILENRRERHQHKEKLEVLDILTCQQSDFEERIPGIGKVLATPIVGIWSEGALIERASGYKAVKALGEHYRLSSQLRLGSGFCWPYLYKTFS